MSEARRYPRTELVFARRNTTFAQLLRHPDAACVLDAAERLLSLTQGLPVENVDKLAEVGSMEKLAATLSELRVANLFARLGFHVVVHPDQADRDARYTPDLSARRGALEFDIEVRQGSDGSTDLAGPLDRVLRARGLPYDVEYRPGLSLSRAWGSHRDRDGAERERDEVLEKLASELSEAPAGSSGTITIGAHSFDFRPSEEELGHAGGGVISAHFIDEPEKARRFLEAIEQKARKRCLRSQARRERPFVVAYDSREPWLRPRLVRSALTGRRCVPTGPWRERREWLARHPANHPQRVRDALSGPWAALLEAWDFGEDSTVRFESYGALLEEPWAGELSAVLVTHITGEVQWFPNPYADDRMCVPSLIDVGLPWGDVEARHEAWQPHP